LWVKEISCIVEAVPPTLRRVRKAPERKPPNERALHYIEQQREVQKLLLPRLRTVEAPRRLELPHVGKGLAAELAGVTPAHLRAFEKGETPLNEDKRARLMAAYGITYREWLQLELEAAEEVANRPYKPFTVDPAAVAEAKEAAARRRRRGGRGGEQE
jgi:plasmid maintenance system antidote protein VapI